ncbi:MAG: cupin domain-containing protein [Chitinophagaceae bacterium]
MEQQPGVFRRIVTGHDKEKKAVILSDEPPARTYMIGGPDGAKFYEVWNTRQSPALIDSIPVDAEETNLALSPPNGGTRIRVIDFPPEGAEIRNLTNEEAGKQFKSMGGESAFKSGQSAPHPLMHRTATIDYGIVIAGEMTLVTDQDEVTIKAGDIVIQRGTNHAWANRSGSICRMAFILIDGQFTNDLV